MVRKWEKFVAVARNLWKRWGNYTNWTLSRPNQQQDLNQDTNSKLRTLKLKYAKAMVRKGCRTGKRYGTGLMGRTQEHLKLRVFVNLTLFLKLWLPLDENKGDPIFRKVLVTLDFVEMRQKSIRLPNNTIRNPTIFLFFWYLSLTRSTKEVTIPNLSLNKWKTSPAEFSEDCEKCENKQHEVKTQTLEANLEILKFTNPPIAGIDRSKIFFLSILVYETLKSEFVCKSYGCLTNGLSIRGQNGPKVRKICGGG